MTTAQKIGTPKPNTNGAGKPSIAETTAANLTDVGNGARLAHRHGSDLRFCWVWRKWLAWTGKRWQIDAEGEVVRRAKETVRSLYAAAAKLKDDEARRALVAHARASERAARIAAMIDMARSEPGMDIAPDALDCDAWALNVENGTLDLRTGDLREHRREDYCTKLAPVGYDAAALAPTWLAFLNRIFRGNASLIDFMQRLAGYCLTADVGEQVLPIFHGVGANGKSTLLGALLELLGPDYSAKLAPEVVLLRRGESHPTGATDLFGRRMVCVVETDAGKRLAEATIKDLTGGDAIRARRMREDYWQFRPTHKIVMATNHRPAVRGTDHALWRRLRLVPFGEIIGPDEQDRQLPDKLRAELPGILAWAVRGCKQWLAQGLGEPPEVTAATDEYRDTQDLLGAFIAERCFIGPNLRTKAGDLYASYVGWCKDTGETALSQSRFGETLSERGFPREKSGVFWRLGIGLKADQDL